MAPQCSNTTIEGPVPSDAGVAGTGVLLSFFFTAILALGLSLTIILSEFRNKTSSIRRRLLSSYSDQQILQGIGIHAVGLAKRDTMLPYHFFIIWCLGLLSQAVHNATLLSLVHDFRRDWVLRWLRQLLMFVNLGLSVVYGVFILRAVETGLADDPIPISCVWETNSGNGSSNRSGLSYFGTIAVMAANVLVFALASWYLHCGSSASQNRQAYGPRAPWRPGAGALFGAVLASDALGHGPSFELAPGEEAWSFGQVLSVLVLLFPLVSMVEILRGELRVAPCDLSDGQACAPSDMEMNKFQPNPFWGSQTHLVRK
ncbi:conserved hypothetical protein [Verticillium alfalfae VaMs.102]|uniref:Uncharacterized protein n=1 Tax=Verticillium alfalfae (strain VaMs.102 / ATCC MYA-4576 / FGSC 10136) TaxID=526221 RepID=C9SF02_VERA1|nr:conserved hypothetical protein [Verticillium alfalfae VaMs.102]EEY17788.1 conserved hypothetical protein [Verticillium alfalfae VaMs.102]